MLPNFDIYMAKQLNNNLLIGTTYGPLFLDEDDFKQFKFDPKWLIDNIDTYAAHELLSQIKQYYMKLATNLYKECELS